jgi:hypothetical protein
MTNGNSFRQPHLVCSQVLRRSEPETRTLLVSRNLGQSRHERLPGFTREHDAICACSNCAVWSGAGQTHGPFNYSQRLSSEALRDGRARGAVHVDTDRKFKLLRRYA